MLVLVADTDPTGRKLVRKIVERCPGQEVVGEADDLHAAASVARDVHADAIVLASAMLTDGRTDVGDLVHRTDAAVILTAISGTGAAVWSGLSGGASGYLLRDRLANDLPQALIAAEAGGAFVSPPLTRQMIGYMADRLVDEEAGVSAASIADLLLPRERETLLRLADGQSTEEIAAIMSVTTATVRAYVSRILRKLGLRSRGEAIALAYRSRFYSPAV
ncbi:LuxR C-terminal-related transcriptional regulator [Micromonospora echinofusca]|uniref:Two component transcriptional regulator, LuxR family n=1 Tax=Micromonospora echinofusca TaxID=47858 RepID=A0ABS3VTF6_MICEH|nr:response regulator transcription factor [Micromonospora echinofusca]MBO4207822.1 hypothetical protein [Micromonospora echinofusca]